MLLMAIAYLSFQIEYNNSLNIKTVVRYQQQRRIITKCAIDIGISVEELKEKIDSISDKRYPSDRQIDLLSSLIEYDNYSLVDNYIPDSDLVFKTDEELRRFKNIKAINRSGIQFKEEKEFLELCQFVQNNIVGFVLNKEMKNRLKKMKTKEYDYTVILQAFKWNASEIDKSIRYKIQNEGSFKDDYSRFAYIVGIIAKKLPDVLYKINRDKRDEEQYWEEHAQLIIDGEDTLENLIYLNCDKYESSLYNGKHKYVREELLSAIRRLKERQK